MEGYNVEIRECSTDLTPRERIKLKDTTNAIKLDEAVSAEKPLVISPVAYAVLDIHNEKSDNKDYPNYIIMDDAGNKYVTGSESFWTTFKDIFDEMAAANEPYEIEIYKVDSKNYKGKQFITCSIV